MTGKLSDVQELIHQLYYKEVDDDTLLDGAVHGMVQSLEDPYSEYYNEEEWEEFQKQQSGRVFGHRRSGDV